MSGRMLLRIVIGGCAWAPLLRLGDIYHIPNLAVFGTGIFMLAVYELRDRYVK